jgi:hypothetical protein
LPQPHATALHCHPLLRAEKKERKTKWKKEKERRERILGKTEEDWMTVLSKERGREGRIGKLRL